ncbi:MAG: type I-E CRISPR-associated protein Cas7/Cse4/CasC [Chloroflexales bacterium]|nr:type I-E CRISPR-associated protein Cas7/Cse4/CasC [Chloroflexales bacterium]
MTLIAIHLLQNHAPSNLNRDDNGDPKDCLFGGHRRARISSQALKRSVRSSGIFTNYFTEQPEVLAVRTQLLPSEVQRRLVQFDLDDQVKAVIVEAAAKFGKADKNTPVETGSDDSEEEATKSKGKKSNKDAAPAAPTMKTKQLMFLTAAEIDQLTTELVALYREKGATGFAETKWDKFHEKNSDKYIPHSVDIAMFGRMTTSSPFKDIEAAVQVAHAFSTHAVEQEFDFYTAVDDISGEAGAGFLGETAFNSATYYKYINIHWEGLVENLQGDASLTIQAVRALTHALMVAIPSGKQNSFAAHNLPDLALIEVRPQNIALSCANAFVKPVRATAQRSLIEASAEELQAYIPQINTMYGLTAERAFLSTVPFALEGAQHFRALDELLEWLPVNA